jgi:hypothetical protein
MIMIWAPGLPSNKQRFVAVALSGQPSNRNNASLSSSMVCAAAAAWRAEETAASEDCSSLGAGCQNDPWGDGRCAAAQASEACEATWPGSGWLAAAAGRTSFPCPAAGPRVSGRAAKRSFGLSSIASSAPPSTSQASVSTFGSRSFPMARN